MDLQRKQPQYRHHQTSSGKYKLEVKCTNGDRVWSNQIYSLHLDVAYPWWLSTTAFIIYFILIAIAIYITQSVIKNRIRLNRQILLEHIEKQNQQRIHESKLNFFTNVAHEFFTPLTLIYGPHSICWKKQTLTVIRKGISTSSRTMPTGCRNSSTN